MSIIIEQKQLDKAKEERVVRRIKDELNVDDIKIEYDRALVMM